jgi:3-oxoacyl-[acyl-carrier protein] reductase
VLSLSNLARTGLWAWARTAAADLAAEAADITLNLVCPGPHGTPRMVELGGSDGAPMGDPADFGQVVAFLCSRQAAFVNGAAVVVDGGLSGSAGELGVRR